MSKWNDLDLVLEQAVRENVFPGAVLLVTKPDREIYFKAVGSLSAHGTEPMRKYAIFDVASLTKVICTTHLVMTLSAENKLSLDDAIGMFFKPREIAQGLSDITIRDIMRHISGIKGYVPFFRDVLKRGKEFTGTDDARRYIFERARLETPSFKRGENYEYSDLGFIILAEIIEKVAKENFAKLCSEKIFSRLKMTKSSFIPWKRTSVKKIYPRSQIVPTEYYDWIGGEACGVVHDENCYAMGGVSGHAGLFSTMPDIAKFISELFRGWRGKSKIWPQELCRLFFLKPRPDDRSPYAIGWKTPSSEDMSSGDNFSKLSIGHLGYTGCSIWIDLEKEIGIVLLSNRVNPSRENIQIRKFRPLIHDLTMKIAGYGR
jgi:serine-type D-Ala-D-Ala carboxypeptidase